MSKDKKLKIDSAASFYDGVAFDSKRKKGFVARATMTEQGTVVDYGKKRQIMNDDFTKYTLGRLRLVFITVIPAIAILILMGIKLDTISFIKAQFLVNGVVMIISVMLLSVIENMTSKGLMTSKFHSAEHMCINALKKLQRVPNLKELKTFSRFENDCGTNAILQMSAMYIAMFFVLAFAPTTLVATITLLGINILIIILLKLGCLNFLQYYTTVTPSDTELEVALSALQVWFDNETNDSK